MRILFALGTTPWPGYREGVAAIVDALAAEGHRVAVVSRTQPDAEWFARNTRGHVEEYNLDHLRGLPLSAEDLRRYRGPKWAECRQNARALVAADDRADLPEAAASYVYGVALGALMLLHRHTPDCLLVYNPYWLEYRPLVGAARELGIPVFYYEKGMLPGSFQLDEGGINGASSLAAATTPEPYDEEQVRADLERLRQELFGSGKTGWRQPTARSGPDQLRRRLGVGPDRRVMLYVGQVSHDSNILEFSPHFDSNGEALHMLLETLPDGSNWFVLGKKHPKGRDDDAALRALLGERGAWTGEAHLHDCLELADCVASINSSVVLEALLQHKPTVLLGQGIFCGKGVAFEYDGTNRDDLRGALAAEPLEPFADAGLIDYWCWRAACCWLYRCRPQDLPAEGRRAARYVLDRLSRAAEVTNTDVTALLPALMPVLRQKVERLETYRQSYEHIMGRLPVRIYKAMREWLDRLLGRNA